jgi:AIPR protein
MAANDLVILKQVLEQDKSERFPHLADSSYFEIFVTEQILKNYELNDDEIDAGITGAGNDGGIDSFFTFVNGQLLYEDTDLAAYKKAITIDVFITQTKRSEGFEGAALDKISATLKEILDLSTDLNPLKSVYDEKLLQAAESFRRAYKQLASRFPDLNISIAYASLGDVEQIHPNVRRKAEILELELKGLLPHCEPNLTFYGAKELLDLARKNPSTTLQVDLFDYIAGKKAYLCLINLRDYYTFISDNKKALRKHIFETNVRDYQGKVEVNEGIKQTLESDSKEDFWWLNNGITIIAANATISSKTITLEDPQIVNGLQTSTEIFEYFKTTNPKTPEERSVLVKIIVTTSSGGQENIIRATNSQTAVPLASLKATDKVQRDIEDYFRNNDLYYDRRKNFYKNQKIQRDKIISISYLAQAVMALVFQEPNEARARPSSILKKDPDYKKIFNLVYPLQLYLNCIKIMRLADHYIKSDKTFAATEEKNNLRFHFALYLALSMTGRRSGRRERVIEDIANLRPDSVSPGFLSDKWIEIITLFRAYQAQSGKTNPDTIGKSREFVRHLLECFPDDSAIARTGKGASS